MADQQISYDVSDEDKLWGLLAYIFPPFVPLLILLSDDKKNQPFQKYHAVLSLGWFVFMWATTVIIIGFCLSPVYFLISCYFGYKAYLGECFEVPYLTDFLRGQGWLE